MDEFKYPQKNDDLKQFVNDNADLIGSGISGILTLFFPGDPIASAFTGPAGTLVARVLKGIGTEFSGRQLSPREDIRVGKVLAIAALEIRQRLEKDESLRNDGFFDKKPTGQIRGRRSGRGHNVEMPERTTRKEDPVYGIFKSEHCLRFKCQRGYGAPTHKDSRRTDLPAVLYTKTRYSEKSLWLTQSRLSKS